MYTLIVYAYGERRSTRFASEQEACSRAAVLATKDATDIVTVRRGADSVLVYEYVRRPSRLTGRLAG
jgi:hypothetical protein